MTAYYNEFDPHAAQWLRNLIAAGVIAPGDVDERSIEDVTPNDLRGYTQCHFFAGIGGWAYALDLAGWPRDRPVWTGSCPCQPFSSAGKGAGFADERHLWPAWFHLIRERRPGVVFGEQVASKAVDPWIDLVHADLEGMGYAFGCVPFPSAGVGAPHIRDRAFWVAERAGYANNTGLEKWRDGPDEKHDSEGRKITERPSGLPSLHGGLADLHGHGRKPRGEGLAAVGHRAAAKPDRGDYAGRGPTNGQWRAADWLGCTDGKWRPVEPGTFPLAHGVSGQVGLLRGYGNAIVPQAAAEFISAYAEAVGIRSEAASGEDWLARWPCF